MSEDRAVKVFREAVGALEADFSEMALARAMLAAVDALHAGVLAPATADHVFTALDRHLTESSDGPLLSDEAQELIFEGEHLHHLGDEYGPDLTYLCDLAHIIIDREERMRMRA